jgi:hypothetical protein
MLNLQSRLFGHFAVPDAKSCTILQKLHYFATLLLAKNVNLLRKSRFDTTFCRFLSLARYLLSNTNRRGAINYLFHQQIQQQRSQR